MTEPSISLQFFDPASGLRGSTRQAATILFEGRSSRVLPEGPRIEADGDGWRAELDGELALELQPAAESAALAGTTTRICTVKGKVGGRGVQCLGTVVLTHEPPAWEELDAVRSITALFDESNAILAVAHRPRGALGHDAEETAAWILRNGEVEIPETVRISTVYDGEGRPRSAGLELWLPDGDFPVRTSGSVLAGSSLRIGALEAHIGVFGWHIDSLEGVGSYEIMVRTVEEAA